MEAPEWKRIIVGSMLLLLALYLGGLGMYYFCIPAESFAAPRWIFFLLALLVGFGAGLAMLDQKNPLTNLLAAGVWILFATVGIWAALFSPLETLSGGAAILSTETNRILARILFGVGAILNSAAGIYAGWLFIKK